MCVIFYTKNIECDAFVAYDAYFNLTRHPLVPSDEGGHPHPAVVPALPGAHGGAAPLHLDHLPEHRVRGGAGPGQGRWLNHGGHRGVVYV